MRIIELTEEARTNILENLLKRSPNSYGEFEGRVNEIIENVRANRDAAIFDYTKRFDGAGINAENILVTEDEIKEAYEKVDEKLLTVIRKALVNIRKYHEKQRQYSWFEGRELVCCRHRSRAFQTVYRAVYHRRTPLRNRPLIRHVPFHRISRRENTYP